MDHPLSAPDALVRPWRTAAYVAVAVAAVELLLLLLIGGGKLVGWASDRVQLAAQKHALAPVKQAHQTAARKPAPTPVAKRCALEDRRPRPERERPDRRRRLRGVARAVARLQDRHGHERPGARPAQHRDVQAGLRG